MITIEQWRLRIGAFAGGKTSVCANVRTTLTTFRTTLTTSGSGYAIVHGLLLFSYALFIIAKSLICSGDIECNPGPMNCKKCPNCLNDTL